MKVNLAGLISTIKDCLSSAPIRKRYGAMSAYCLDELEEHIRGLASGKYTLDEFAEHYCLDRTPHKPESEAA